MSRLWSFIFLRLNANKGTPGKPDYKITAQPGNYHLSQAYGGVNLCQMATEGGGTRNVFYCGHVTKRDLAGRIDAYIAGISTGKMELDK